MSLPPAFGDDSPLGNVGIEKIGAYPGTLMVDLMEVARHRGADPEAIAKDLLVNQRSINPLWEDPVTMAVNAARPLLTDEDREAIELVIIGTESSVDQSKAMSTFAHNFLGLKPNCRNYEVKHACYAGTNAVMMAAHYVASGVVPGAKVLVISTDHSRVSLNEDFEYTMGCGAMAMLISANPRVLRLDLRHNGYFTSDVQDTFRPTSLVETGNGEESLYCYLDALEGALENYLSKAGDINLNDYFQWHLYHVPFGGMAFQAHRTALRQWRKMKKSEAMAHFEERVLPAMVYNQNVGATYGASTFLFLLGLLAEEERVRAGDKVSIFSYGSGSAGEFYPAEIGPDAVRLARSVNLRQRLADRPKLPLDEYEHIEHERERLTDQGTWEPDTSAHDGHYAKHYEGKGLLVFKGIKDYFRTYDWS